MCLMRSPKASRRLAAAVCLTLHLAPGCASGPGRAASGAPGRGEPLKSPRDEAIALLGLMNMAETLEHSLDQMLEIQLQGNAALAPFKDIMRAFLAKYMSWEGLKEDFIRIYVDSFSAQELRDLADFYRTPTGVKAVYLLPSLSSQGAKIGQRRVQEHMGELEALVKQRALELQAGAGAD